MKLCELKILGMDNRTKLTSILVENGYKVSMEDRRNPNGYTEYDKEYFIIIEDKK